MRRREAKIPPPDQTSVRKWSESASSAGEPDATPAFRIFSAMNQEATAEAAITARLASTIPIVAPSRNLRTPSRTIHQPMPQMITPWNRVPNVSIFPWPYGWFSSAGSIAFRIDRKLTPDMRMSARLSTADESTPREPETTPTTNLRRQRATALPREKRAVRRRRRRFSDVPAGGVGAAGKDGASFPRARAHPAGGYR